MEHLAPFVKGPSGADRARAAKSHYLNLSNGVHIYLDHCAVKL